MPSISDSIIKKGINSMLMFAIELSFLSFMSVAVSAQAPATASPASQAAAKPAAARLAKIDLVTVTEGKGSVNLEITTSRSTPMKSQVTTDPDRLILDFPQALLDPGVHSQLINRGEVKGFRVGLFEQKPPVTRVVIDLNSALPYRIYPSGNTVIVKLMTGDKGVGGRLNDVSYTPPIPAKPAPVLRVEFANGRLSVLAHDVSLSRVLNEIQSKTGADVTVPPIASQEQIVADTGELPIRDALTALLNGSRFNFILVGTDDDPSKVKKVILTFRSGGVSQPAIAPPPPPAPPEPAVENSPQPEPPPPDQPQPGMQPQPDGAGQQEGPAPPDNPPPQ